ncbi:MAG: hypothetical protein KDA61_19495, partial [Planctomycetales bacterium]|nr:hypothetical protein [Planctomycetales bacterium]
MTCLAAFWPVGWGVAVGQGQSWVAEAAVDCVNPLSGANGDAEFSRGNTLVAITAPFGMNTWAPQTDGDASPFYQVKHKRFEGMRLTHQPSIWVRDYGDLLVMPVTGVPQESVKQRGSGFRHEREVARPYYYSVDLDRYAARFEVVPTTRCALMRITHPVGAEASIVFTLEGEVETEWDSENRRIRGKATHVTFGAPGGFGNYFVAEFDRPFSSVEVSVADRTKTIVVRFSAEAEANSTSLRIGASFIGYEQAMLNQR